MPSYLLRITLPNQPVKTVFLNRLMAVRAELGAKYMLLDKSGAQLAADLKLSQTGSTLVIEAGGQKMVYLNGYYKPGMGAVFETAQAAVSAAPNQVVASEVANVAVESVSNTSAPASSVAIGGGASSTASLLSGASLGGSGLLLGGAVIIGSTALVVAGKDEGEGASNSNASHSDKTAPRFSSGASISAINENSGANQVIYQAIATDDVSAVTYSLKATNDASSFGINANNGEVTLTDNPNYRTKASYSFTVVATDTAGNSSEQNINLNVQSVPGIRGISISKLSTDNVNAGYFKTGDMVVVSVMMLTDVTVTGGQPSIDVSIGSNTVKATYDAAASNASNLVFKYTISAGQTDSDGINIIANSLQLNGSSIQDSNKSNATLTHEVLSVNSLPVDTSPPTAKLVYPQATQLEALNKNNGADINPQVLPVGTTGQYLVAWIGDNSASGKSIFVQKMNADGSASGNTIEAGTIKDNSTFNMVQINSDGQFAIAWSSYEGTLGYSTFVQRFNPDASLKGVKQAFDGYVVDLTPTSAPRLTALGAGEFVLAWNNWDRAPTSSNDSPSSSVLVQKFNSDGTLTGNFVTKLKAPGMGSSPLSVNMFPVVTSVGNNGDFVVAWQGMDKNANGTSDDSILVQKFNKNGITTGDTLVLEALGNTTGADYAPQITALGSSGAFAVAWMGADSTNGRSIFVQKIDANGVKSAAAVQLSGTTSSMASNDTPVIVGLGNTETFALAWTGVNSAKGTSVFVQTFKADGTVTSATPTQLDVTFAAQAQTNSDSKAPAITTVGTNGDFVVSWQGKNTSGHTNILLQKFAADGSKIGSQIQLDAPNFAGGDQSSPQLATLGTDGAFAVTWYGTDHAGDLSVFVQQFDKNAVPNTALSSNQITHTASDFINLSSTDIGKIYLVHDSINVSKVSDITSISDSKKWTAIDISNANGMVATNGNNIAVGTYKIYAADIAGNLSSAAANTYTLKSVSSAAISSANGAQNNTLNAGDEVLVTLNMAKVCTVDTTNGKPSIALDIGGSIVQASYDSGSGSQQLVFKYKILAGQNDSDGIAISADGLTLNGGKILDSDGYAVSTVYDAVLSNRNYVVDTTAPTVSLVNGTPSTDLTINSNGSVPTHSNEVGKAYLVASSATLDPNSPNYGQVSPWLDGNISATGLAVGSYKLYAVDKAGNISAASSNTINIVAQNMVSLSSASSVSNNTLNTGDVVTLTFTPSEAVTVTGTPKMALTLDGTGNVLADYDAINSSSTALRFNYTIQAGQNDSNGISIPVNTLTLGTGSAINTVTSPHALDISSSPATDNASFKVDTTAPVFQSGTTATAIAENSGANQVIYTAQTNDSNTSYTLKNTGDAELLHINDKTGAVSLIADPNFEVKPSYGFTVVATDSAENQSEQTVSLAVTNLPEPNTAVIIFDLVEGVSSSHSNRTFAANVSYTIYIRTDSNHATLSHDGKGPNAASTWGTWKGADKLGSDDKVILVGNGDPVKGYKFGDQNALNTQANAVKWLTERGSYAAQLFGTGKFSRAAHTAKQTWQLWTGAWANPDKNAANNTVYLPDMSHNLLTSQGLA